NKVIHNLVAMQARGWLQQFPNFAALLRDFAGSGGTWGQWIILMTEFAGILILWNKRVFQVFLVAMLGLHGSVFFMNGANFLPWVISGLWLGFLQQRHWKWKSFPWAVSATSLLVIWFLPQWIFVPKLAWYDGPLDARFEMTQEQNGKVENINPGILAPYHAQFILGTLREVVHAPGIGIGFLQVEYPHYAGLMKVGNSGLADYVAQHGHVAYQQEAYDRLRSLLDSFGHHHSKYTTANLWLRRIQLPSYLNADKTSNFVDFETGKDFSLWYRQYYWTEEQGSYLFMEEKVR
ncbi:MAG: hypothetical protein LPK45_10940, partial [Bacteroidota bacterium]|nr:hypothetical protein [Bacteroidota bacterium]MDX5431617.1 hypothetical protein [Bacteroidota bacterium]MDX5470336.1 hypothetical protein [Bacteroidota bacterium]